MPAQFGAFQVNRPCRHVYGESVEMDLQVGRYEPKDAAELDAMRHLTGVNAPPGPDGEPGEPFATQIEDPAPPVSAGQPAPEPVTTEPVLPEPPAAPAATGPAASATSAGPDKEA